MSSGVSYNGTNNPSNTAQNGITSRASTSTSTSSVDVLNSQSQLFQTKRDLAQARYNVLLGDLRLRLASGTLTPEDLQQINGLLAR